MSPSPALRCSPGRELRTEHNHKRGRSFESSVLIKTKDDDLTLFTDMESRDRDNFLLQTADDLNDSIARLRYYSDLNLGVNIPARGETSDLLNVDGEKNDYDWLVTPPDTPLFRSLDDEGAQPVNPTRRGRQQSQPISIRSSGTEKTQRTSRSSYSPHRLSSSPRSTTGVTQPKGTPSSAPCSSSSLTALRPMTPSRRPSTPPNKPSATTPRSSTPTLRRMSTGSSGQAASPGRRGTSPVRPSRGNSASPKLRGWPTNLGFSSDPPVNLRTSLTELPSSNFKAMSPASRNGRQSMSPTAPRNRRQSMSPTASRSTTSLHSHERDRFSTYSRGSVASSGDDDADSLYSLGIETSSSPTRGKNGIVANSRAIPFSKKPDRTPSASSVPKRSFDSALRQDHRKTPQNMFRPLLSSVPTSTFYTGKTSSVHRPLFSRNSSVTTSSNASSELGVIVAHDIVEADDHGQNDLPGEWEKPQDFDTQEEIFIFDKMEEISENGHSVGGVTNKVDPEELEKSTANFGDPGCMAPAFDASYLASIPSRVDCLEMLKACSKCGNQFHIMDADSITDVCQECVDDDWISSEAASQPALLVAQNECIQSVALTGIDRLSEEMKPAVEISELPALHENNVDQDPDFVQSSSACNTDVDLTEQSCSDQQSKSCHEMKAVQSESKFQEPRDVVTHPSPRVSSLEGTGISVLLQRSSSSKWPVVQGRAFSATSIMCSEPSYTRDHANVMRRSFSRDSGSASSSVDLASSRQSEFRVQRQLSSRRADTENTRNDGNVKAQITESLNSGVSSEQTFNAFVDAVDFERKNSLENMRTSSTKSMTITQAVVEGHLFSCADSRVPVDSLHACDTSLVGFSEAVGNNGSIPDSRVEHGMPDSSCIGEEYMIDDSVCGNEVSAVATETSSSVIPRLQITLEGVQDLQSDSTASIDPNNMDISHECSGSALPEKDSPSSAMESNIIDQPHEKSVITVEGQRGHMSRSLTLEEATDTILFCSSIIHDLAYKAATLGMEKEEYVTEPLRPAIPSKANTVSNQKEPWTSSYKRTPKPLKTKRKRLEPETNTTVTELGDNTKIQNTMPSNPDSVPNKVDSAKPPKLESKCNCTIM